MYTWQGEKRTRCGELYGAWQIQKEHGVPGGGVKDKVVGGQGLAYEGLMLGIQILKQDGTTEGVYEASVMSELCFKDGIREAGSGGGVVGKTGEED